MNNESIVICGLPGSGKTTYLAALWHFLRSQEVKGRLGFGSLRDGEWSHLNGLAKTWEQAKPQERTKFGTTHLVSMNATGAHSESVRITFPDLSGEIFQRMWEERDCDEETSELLRGGSSLMLFVHADQVKAAQYVVEEMAMDNAFGEEHQERQAVPWLPSFAPTQIQLIDLLQLLNEAPLSIGRRKVVIVFSAWDLLEDEGRTPDQFLREWLPMLYQHLKWHSDEWEWRAYGISAQGGDYTDAGVVDELLERDVPSNRIKLVHEYNTSSDITEPLAWLMQQEKQ